MCDAYLWYEKIKMWLLGTEKGTSKDFVDLESGIMKELISNIKIWQRTGKIKEMLNA